MNYLPVNYGFVLTGEILFQDSAETIPLDKEIIRALHVKEDYIDNVLPLVSLDLKISATIRNKLRDNYYTIYLRGQSYDASQNYSVDADSSSELVLEDAFELTLRGYEFKYLETDYRSDPDQNDATSLTDMGAQLDYTVSGIPEDLIILNENIINYCFEDSTSYDAILYILSKHNEILKKPIYLQESTLNEVFPSLLVPPMNITKAISFIQSQYGLYEDGINFFASINGMYLYSFNNEDSTFPYINELEVNFIPIDQSNQEEYTQKITVAENGNMKINLTTKPTFAYKTPIQCDELGTTQVFFSYDEYFANNINIYNNGSDDAKQYPKTRYFFNENGRSLYENEFFQQKKFSIGTRLAISGIKPDMISPLTKIRVKGAPEYANGNYMVAGKSYSISTTDHTHFNSVVVFDIIRINQ